MVFPSDREYREYVNVVKPINTFRRAGIPCLGIPHF
jgi:hypothetical protein